MMKQHKGKLLLSSGLILLPIIFYPILGFGKAKFRRRKRRRKVEA